MRLRSRELLLSLLVSASLSATPLQIPAAETEVFYSNNVVGYRMEANPSGTVPPGQTGFGLSPAGPWGNNVQSYSVTSTLFSLVFVNSLPSGSTIGSATLDLDLALTPGTLVASVVPVPPPTWSTYVPNFTSTAAGGYITIQSGTTSAPVPAYPDPWDLIALGFQSELEAGNNLTVSWSQSITFLASHGVVPSCPRCVKIFSLSQSLEGDATGQLDIDYTGLHEQPPIPEPATLILIGGGLVVLGWLARRRIRT